ncbi:MAG: hypothetical protein ABIJ85_00625 [bacterium]
MEEQIAQPVQNQAPQILKKFAKPGFKAALPYVVGSLLVVLLGVGTGWLLSGRVGKGGNTGAVPGAKVTVSEAGVDDEANFSNTAEGLLETGGVNGEGTHHLTRDGGPSQTVKLTSTTVDLEGFVGKKVTIWGETITARKGGWLMDVGKIKVIE